MGARTRPAGAERRARSRPSALAAVAARTVAVLALAVSFAAPARAQLALELVVDGSGSMWGQLGGLPKTIVLREALKSLMDRMERQDVRIGMTTFGTLASTGCDNVDTVVPLAPAENADVLGALTNLNPRGLSPVVEAIKRAGGALASEEGKRAIVVVADGGDGCVANPCEALRAWRGADGPLVYVIGLAVSDSDAEQQLACFAEAGAGAYVNASTIRAIEDTLRSWVDKLVALDRDERLARQRARAESERIRQATHVRIELVGHLAPAYCQRITVAKAELDAKPLALAAPDSDLPCQGSTKLFDSIVDPGDHRFTFAYRKHSESGDVVESETVQVPLAIAPAQTTTVSVDARAGLLRYRAVPNVTTVVTSATPGSASP